MPSRIKQISKIVTLSTIARILSYIFIFSPVLRLSGILLIFKLTTVNCKRSHELLSILFLAEFLQLKYEWNNSFHKHLRAVLWIIKLTSMASISQKGSCFRLNSGKWSLMKVYSGCWMKYSHVIDSPFRLSICGDSNSALLLVKRPPQPITPSTTE